MNVKKALDTVVEDLKAIDVHLSGDDSPLANPWEEIKDQLQNELSFYWEAYVITMKQCIAGFLSQLDQYSLSDLLTETKSTSSQALEEKLLRRLLQRGRKEKIQYAAFDFTYFCYRLYDFTVYGKILKRTGMHTCLIKGYSKAAPSGEQGEINTDRIERILTQKDFEKARSQNWPEEWNE